MKFERYLKGYVNISGVYTREDYEINSEDEGFRSELNITHSAKFLGVIKYNRGCDKEDRSINYICIHDV